MFAINKLFTKIGSLKKSALVFFLFFSSLFWRSEGVYSQTYPVQLSTHLIPPYSGYLPDYADPSSEKLKVILQFNDFTVPQYNVRLKFEIKGNGFTLTTKQLFNPPPLQIEPGVPFMLSGVDLAPYINSNNLDFTGINQSQYEQRMALPEGYYSICVKAYDYYNGNNVQVSNEAYAQAWFTLSDPPFLNLPMCDVAVVPQTPQNILFQWTPMNMGSPNSSFNTEYLFELWECRPDTNANPNQIIQSTPPIYSTTTQQTVLNYGLTEPPLNLYMKYVWRVKAQDISGRDLFKNQGYSQICTFNYGSVASVLGSALTLNLTAQGITHRMGKCTWNTQSLFTTYKLQVRKQGTVNWFDYNTTQGSEKVTNLEPNTDYEAQVQGEGNGVTSAWSNIATFRTNNEPSYNCSDQTQLADPLQAQPLPIQKAVVGLIIQTGQFEVITTQITPTGAPGWYSGKGYARVFGVLPLAVQWSNIYIDDNNRHQQGIIQAMTKGIDAWVHQWDVAQGQENAGYVNGTITSFTVNNGQYCYTLQGNNQQICAPTPTGVNVFVVRDDSGNEYTIQLQPPPPTVTGPTNYLQVSTDNLAACDSLQITFEAYTQQAFGFDTKEYAANIPSYECIKLGNGQNYFVPYKSIGETQTDEVIANVQILNFNATNLSFKTQSGTTVSFSNVGTNKFKLTGISSVAGCVYAYYNNKKIAKLNVVSLKPIAKKVVIVPVNNATLNSQTTQDLNTIYKQANVTWSITNAGNFTFNLGTDGLEAADATLLSKYSAEMRALRDAYKQATPNYDKDAYYVFVVSNFSNAQMQGYMVRGRALGFVTASVTAKELAHELAHGAFGLEHSFPKIEQNTSNNLLDYGSGKQLTKTQWDEMQNPNLLLSWNDNEEDGAMLQSEYFSKYNPNSNNESDGFVPRWIWDNSLGSVAGLPVYAGFVDAICSDLESVVDLAKAYNCWNFLSPNASQYSSECIDIRSKTVETGKFVLTLVRCNAVPALTINDPECAQLNTALNSQLNTLLQNASQATLPEAQYNFGKAVWYIGSLFIGVGEVNAVVKGGVTLTKTAVTLSKIKPFLSSVSTLVNSGVKCQKIGKFLQLSKLAKDIIYVEVKTGVIIVKNELTSYNTVLASLGKKKIIENGALVEKELSIVSNQAGDIGVLVRNVEETMANLLIKQKQRLQNLKTQHGNLDFIDFNPVGGKTTNDITSSMYNEMISDLNSRVGWSMQDKANKVIEILGSGKTVPQKITYQQGTDLFKIVKKDGIPSQTTEYWFTKTELDALMSKGTNFESKAGLPLGSMADEYDIFKITANQPSTTYRSTIASTTQRGYTTTGGAIQTLVLDRSTWSLPVKNNPQPFIPDF